MPKQTSKELNNFWANVCKTIHPILSDTCLSCPFCPDCDVGVLWLNGWMDQDETCMQIGLGPGHIVLDGDPAMPTERGTAAPTFEIYRHRLCLRLYNPRPMSILAKWLDGSRCHLVRRQASALATLC